MSRRAERVSVEHIPFARAPAQLGSVAEPNSPRPDAANLREQSAGPVISGDRSNNRAKGGDTSVSTFAPKSGKGGGQDGHHLKAGSERRETSRQRTYRLLSEILEIGSPRHRERAERIRDELDLGARRLTRTTIGLVEATWMEATHHAAAAMVFERKFSADRPAPGTVWAWSWRQGELAHGQWSLAEVNPYSWLGYTLAAELRA